MASFSAKSESAINSIFILIKNYRNVYFLSKTVFLSVDTAKNNSNT